MCIVRYDWNPETSSVVRREDLLDCQSVDMKKGIRPIPDTITEMKTKMQSKQCFLKFAIYIYIIEDQINHRVCSFNDKPKSKVKSQPRVLEHVKEFERQAAHR